jgi:hypothetical protein
MKEKTINGRKFRQIQAQSELDIMTKTPGRYMEYMQMRGKTYAKWYEVLSEDTRRELDMFFAEQTE